MRVILLVSGKLNEWFNSGVLQGVYEELAPVGYDVTPAFITDRSNWTGFLPAAKKPQRGRHHHFLISAHARHAPTSSKP